MVLAFDQRQTSRPVESITGLTGNPIHTMYSLSVDSAFSCGVRSVLTASSSGLCHWDFGRSGEKYVSLFFLHSLLFLLLGSSEVLDVSENDWRPCLSGFLLVYY